MNAISALGAAMDSMAMGNVYSQMTTAEEVLFLIGANFPLAEAWSTQLVKDQEKDFTDNLLIATDPRYAAVAAADYAQYTMDSSAMQQATGYQNNIMQTEKTQVRTLGNGMDQVYNLAQSPEQLLKATSHAILSFAPTN